MDSDIVPVPLLDPINNATEEATKNTTSYIQQKDYVTIALVYGKSDNLTISPVITEAAVLGLGFNKWIIPEFIISRRDYVLEFRTDANNIAFKGQ